VNGLFANYCDVIQTDKHAARQRDSVAMEWRTLQLAKKDFLVNYFLIYYLLYIVFLFLIYSRYSVFERVNPMTCEELSVLPSPTLSTYPQTSSAYPPGKGPCQVSLCSVAVET
jgi:hypothetical protein